MGRGRGGRTYEEGARGDERVAFLQRERADGALHRRVPELGREAVDHGDEVVRGHLEEVEERLDDVRILNTKQSAAR